MLLYKATDEQKRFPNHVLVKIGVCFWLYRNGTKVALFQYDKKKPLPILMPFSHSGDRYDIYNVRLKAELKYI